MLLNKFKIRTKLFLSFFIIILFLVTAVIIGIVQINNISMESNNVYIKDIRTIDTLDDIKNEFVELRRLATSISSNTLRGNLMLLEKCFIDCEAQFAILKTASQAHLNRLLESGAPQDEYFDTAVLVNKINNEYWPCIEKMIASARATEIDEMFDRVVEAGVIAGDINSKINQLAYDKLEKSANDTNNITQIAQNAMLNLLIVAAVAIAVSIFMALYIGNYFYKQVNKLRQASNEIANGQLNLNLTVTSKDELGMLSNDLITAANSLNSVINGLTGLVDSFMDGYINVEINTAEFKGAYKTIADGINKLFKINVTEVLDFMTCATEFANGNFNADLKKLTHEKSIMNTTLDDIRFKLKSVSGDISFLVDSAISGNLEKRANISKYKGDWAKIIDSMNSLMNAVSTPIAEAKLVLEHVAAGNFDTYINGDYKGEFLSIKTSINSMTSNINSYISEISSVLNALAKNDLTCGITRGYVGKFSEIKDALNNIVHNLNNVISDISAASGQVAAGARQISEGSISLAQGAVEQASSVQELNAIVNVIDSKTTYNAESARAANDLSSRSRSNATKGKDEMQRMLEAMSGIKQSSSSISKIIKVIDDLSFQTNLLALNAAVEAARAGAHGKGFAVVAEEVRSLAVQSQNAAKETSQLIEESINKVNEGTQIADITANSLQTIVEDVNKVADFIKNVSSASDEQSDAMRQIIKGLSQITIVVQNNSATSQEAASASEELSGQSIMLQNLVDVFNLKNK